MEGLLKPGYIPPKEQRESRDLTRYRNKLIQHMASEKNRVIHVLEDCNVKLDSVLSSTSGVTATKLINKLIENGAVTMDDINEVHHQRIQASKEDIYLACEWFIDEHQKYMHQVIRKDIEQPQALMDGLSARIKVILLVVNLGHSTKAL